MKKKVTKQRVKQTHKDIFLTNLVLEYEYFKDCSRIITFFSNPKKI